MSDKENFFEKYGLELKHEQPELGKSYLLYGMITSILSGEPLRVEINFNVHADITTTNEEHIKIIRDRAFEPGMFNCTFSAYNEDTGIYEGTCSTVIFGKKVEYNEQ